MKKNEELIYMQKSFVDIQEHIVKRIRRPFFIPLSYINGSPVSYTHLRAHETVLDIVCRLLLEKKKIHILISWF